MTDKPRNDDGWVYPMASPGRIVTDSRVASLAALLQEALDATTVGPAKLFVPVDSEPWWRGWLVRTQEALARGVQYAPREPDEKLLSELYENANAHRDPIGRPYDGWPGLLRKAADRIMELRAAALLLPAHRSAAPPRESCPTCGAPAGRIMESDDPIIMVKDLWRYTGPR